MHDYDVRIEHRRGCGWRKPGGLYLVTTGLSEPCGKLPIPLDVCPTCRAGIKFSRGWTWIDPHPFARADADCLNAGRPCQHCPLGQTVPDLAGLIWIGESFYPSPVNWEREAVHLGVSRRIKAVPRDFVLGQTWVFVAHRKAMGQAFTTDMKPAIFHAFRPTAVEYILRGDESGHELEQLEKRGITPVYVQRAEQQTSLLDHPDWQAREHDWNEDGPPGDLP